MLHQNFKSVSLIRLNITDLIKPLLFITLELKKKKRRKERESKEKKKKEKKKKTQQRFDMYSISINQRMQRNVKCM